MRPLLHPPKPCQPRSFRYGNYQWLVVPFSIQARGPFWLDKHTVKQSNSPHRGIWSSLILALRSLPSKKILVRVGLNAQTDVQNRQGEYFDPVRFLSPFILSPLING